MKQLTIYEALNWIKEAEYTPSGYIIFNENKPEGQMKGKALKTIFEAAKNDELIPVEVFNQVKKERDNLEKLKQEPFISSKVCEHDKEVVIDKIRAEIMKLDVINPDYPMDKTIHISRNEVLQIIDKYREVIAYELRIRKM